MQRTPLYDEHEKIGGKVVDFNGWALPVQFSGIVKEHLHTRSAASLFDCSHMGEYSIKGVEAIQKFSDLIISDLTKVPIGRCRYGAILDESAGILDDLITFRMAEDEIYVVTNAGPIESVTKQICDDNDGAVHVSYETAKIDIQGPKSRDHLLGLGFEAATELKYFNATWTEWEGHKILLARTGYTGELGYELFMDNELAPEVWNRILECEGVEPAGLGARDTIRTEVCYGLSGQDFNTEISPLEAAMEPFIAWDTEFIGKEKLERIREKDEYAVLVPIVTKSRRAPRHDFEVFHGENKVGVVTSGTFGPSVEHGVGLARIDREFSKLGTQLTAGPKGLEIAITEVPVYTQGTCRIKI